MRVVYIAGPYRAKTERGLEQNIRRAEDAALDCWVKGWAAICPHKNTAHFGGACEDRVWLEGDLELLRRCDAVLMIEGWERSEGARGEYALAVEMGKDVYFGEVPYAN